MDYYVVDVFTSQLFGGNPAGVCLLDEWLPDQLLQDIAIENKHAETAFLVKAQRGYHLRWFTPHNEIDLCGHATMASGFVILEFLEPEASKVSFDTLSGRLSVQRGQDGLLWMDLPAHPVTPAPVYACLPEALGVPIMEVLSAIDLLIVLESEAAVQSLAPDFKLLMENGGEPAIPSDNFGFIVTAAGTDCDFVSRYFVPHYDIPEDPVTGRAHTMLTPYWAERLGKDELTARQLSARGGQLRCQNAGPRVKLGGKVQLYLSGTLHLS